jgi:hypothetical protein
MTSVLAEFGAFDGSDVLDRAVADPALADTRVSSAS